MIHIICVHYKVSSNSPVHFIYDKMRRIHSLLGISITTEHVRAHQDDTVPLKERTPQAVINIAMDKEAERIRVSSLPTPPIPLFSF